MDSPDFDGLGMSLGNLPRLSAAVTRSISPENFTGQKGAGGAASEGTGSVAARDLGVGWKISPSINVPAQSTVVLADIVGPGAIQHIWLTVQPQAWRRLVFRCYWDGETAPSVEVPLGDFFCNGWCEHCSITSLPVAVNPAGGFNSYWEMPFRQHARITLENIAGGPIEGLYYQIDYCLTRVPTGLAYFHASWRRSNPLPPGEVHTLLDATRGSGHYVGTYLAWGSNFSGWWGEGEIKFYMDGDVRWPTICGTGTEDYFGGAWGFKSPQGQYGAFTAPFSGMPQVIQPDGHNRSRHRFGLYRWHIMDPIRFGQDLRVTIQALGWHAAQVGAPRYRLLQDDIASTAFWYQAEPHVPFTALPGAGGLEVV